MTLRILVLAWMKQLDADLWTTGIQNESLVGMGSLNWISRKIRQRLLLRRWRASLVVQRVKNLLTVQETLRSLGWEHSLEREMGDPLQCSCLENPMNTGRPQCTGSQRVSHGWATQQQQQQQETEEFWELSKYKLRAAKFFIIFFSFFFPIPIPPPTSLSTRSP